MLSIRPLHKVFADPKRIGIFGASYGGYVTLAGVTFTPDLYACAVDYVGVSNLITLTENDPPYWKPYTEQSYETIGHPVADREQFEATSPLFMPIKSRHRCL